MANRGTIVYVHGASDRAVQVADHIARIERQLAAADMAFDVLASRWGELAGADLSDIEAALPPVDGVAHVAPVPALPTQELRRLAELAARPNIMSTGALPLTTAPRRQSDELLDICRTQVGGAGESIRLAGGQSVQIADACRLAANEIGESADYARARSATVAEATLISAVGHAVAASVAASAAAPFDVAQLVQIRIAEAVIGAALATIFVGYLGIDVGPDLKRWATDVLIPHRAKLVREAGLGPADIVLYQRAGHRIRQVVRDSLTDALARGGPVIALGSSLGGVVLVDLLADPGGPRPDLLVTVGSQAPLLATFGALAPVERSGQPRPFQPWLNIYDRRDLLGFVASRVWPDESGITDHEVDLGLGFPDAHGAAYLDNADVFRAMRGHPALTGAALPQARFDISVGSLSAPARFVLGATAVNSIVEVDGGLQLAVGRLKLRVPLRNLSSWRVGGAHDGATVTGIVGALLGGVAPFGSGSTVTLTFGKPVRWMLFNVRAVEISVEDPGALAAVLSARGIPPS